VSRKGFDSKYGARPSPILKSGLMVSLPIPEEGNNLQYGDLPGPERIATLGDLAERIRSKVNSRTGVHLDPDLRRELHRDKERPWRPLFGQCDAAAKHLGNQGVADGDLFLFFGWFRRVGADFSYEKLAHDEHVLFGWLQIDRSFDPAEERPDWARHHPHCNTKERKNNRVYVGRRNLTFAPSKPGAGVFSGYDLRLRLTHPDHGRQRSYWRLPSFFQGRLTYHATAKWVCDLGEMVSVSSAKIGQEFVLHTAGCEDEVAKWLEKLFASVPDGESY